MTGIDYLSAQLAGLATSLRMMGRDNSADIAQRGAERVEQQARELEELRSLIPVLVERVQRGGPSNLVDIADKYMTEAQAALLRALVAPSVPETPEETKQ